MIPWICILLFVSLAAALPSDGLFLTREAETCGYESCTQAEPDKLNIHIVPHTHDDVGWLKTVDQYYYGSRNNIQQAGVQYILDTVVKELWEDPKRRFIYVETFFFWKWWMHQSDSVRHKVHTLVRQGRLQFVGGAWSMNDEAAVHYQSTIDQFTWGLSKLNDTFGPCGMPRVGWQIDPFGHSREFASLLADMGYHGLFLGRIDYQDKMTRFQDKSMEMLWRGDDDLGDTSDIFTGVLYNTYSPPPGFCFDILCQDEPIIDDVHSPMYNVDKRVEDFLKLISKMKLAYCSNNILITMGDDFNYQDATMWFKNLDKLIVHTNLKAAKEGMKIKLFYSTPDCYLKAVKDANPTIPIKQDDFFPYASDQHSYWTGYFTSRPTTKYFEREGNSYLQMDKQMQVLAGLEEHNIFVLNELKSAMGIMQHHDAITGTEKQHVTHDYERLLDKAIEDANLIPRQAFKKFMQGNATAEPIMTYDRCRLNESSCYTSENSQQFVVTVYNHLAWQVNESVRIPVVEGNYEIYAPNGEKILSQLVEIQESVKNIPTRNSKATHEVVFIAYLHPVSYKSFYIRKIEKIKKREVTILNGNYKKTHDFYNINDYWKNIKDQQNLEIEILEKDVKKARDYKVPEEPVFGQIPSEIGDVDANVLKDKEGFNSDIEQFERIIAEAKKFTSEPDHQPRGKPEMISYPNLSDEEMRMLSDDPMIVERYPDEYVMENQHLILRLNETTGELIDVSLQDGTDLTIGLKFEYYPGYIGDNRHPENRSSGAYIFRPKSTKPIEIPFNLTKGVNGVVVKEIHFTTEDNIAATVRLYDSLDFLELDWVVGPINIKDKIGKEYILKYTTNIVNNGEFFTDSNGRQMLKRKLSQRPQWNLTNQEPIAGNYYPITNKISIQDNMVKLNVLTDRPEGGSSIEEGEIELMLHRRLLHDDAFGVGEALNESANGKGLVVRGRHRVLLTKLDDKNNNIDEKQQVIQYHLQPIIFVSNAKDLSLENWLKLKNCYSCVNELPKGLHLLTVEPWKGNRMLLRIENYLEKADEKEPIEINLQKIFKTLKLKSYKETTLAANRWIEDKNPWSWTTESEFSESFNEAYGNTGFEKAKAQSRFEDDGFTIKFKPKQIRTFVVDYEIQ